MAFPTEAQLTQATGLIVAMFNAAPGKEVLGDVAGALAAGASLQDVAAILATKAEFAAVYPNVLTVQAFADKVVANLLPASTPAEAVTWTKNWITTELAKPGVTREKILVDALTALSVTTDAGFADAKAQFLNRVDVAKYYSITQLQSSSVGLDGLQAVVAGVTNDPASVQDAKDAVDGNLAGQDFNLTVGPDSFTGGTGADVFTAIPVSSDGSAVNTLSTFDKLDGGLGNDTLNIFSDGAKNVGIPAGATITNIETINIANTGAGFGAVDASLFVGATNINQIGVASAVSNLGAGTTAGFDTIAAAAALTVSAAATAASASVSLTKVDETATLKITDAAVANPNTGVLNNVTISGAAVDGADVGSAVGSLAPTIVTGKDVETLTLNTSAAITLTVVDDAASTKEVNTIDAAASTGAITLVGDAELLSLTTGSGDDVLTVDVTSAKAVTLHSGAGDDTVTVAIDQLATGDVIDGGDGVDTLVTAAAGTLTASLYSILRTGLSNFEALKFSAGVTVDGKAVPNTFTDFTFAAASTITNVLDGQTLTTGANLTAAADGYKAGAVYGTDASTYAGTLDITATAAATVIARAESVDLSAAAAVTLNGDVKTATIDLTKAAAVATVATVDAADSLAAMTSLTLSGKGSAIVDNGVDTALVTVDASDLDGGLTYTSANVSAESISLGDGADAIDLGATSTVGSTVSGVLVFDAMDTITNFDVAEDTLAAGAVGAVVVTATGADLTAALVSVAAGSDDIAVFTYGGDAYVYVDANNDDLLDAADGLVKLVGISSADDLADLAANALV
jgi:hypothetical protein